MLGINNNIERDMFPFSTFFHFLSSFDLLGFISPFVVSAQVFPQELWRIKVDWNKLFSERHQENCKELTKNLTKIQPPWSPKMWSCYHAIIHMFSDVLKVAYDAIAYFKFICKTKKPHCLFAMAKTWLAPIKIISLARLVLNAAVLCAW